MNPGSNPVVAVYVRGDHPAMKSDNAIYRATYGLPPGNITQVSITGSSTLPPVGTSADHLEASIDIAAVSAT